MKRITTRERIRNVAHAWKNTYQHSLDIKKMTIYQCLRILPETATAQDVETIIGNRSWVDLECHECGEKVDLVMQLGQEPDDDTHTHTAQVCSACLRKALHVAEST